MTNPRSLSRIETLARFGVRTSLPVKISYTSKQGATDVMLKDFRDVSGVKVAYGVEQWRNGAKFLEAVYTDAQVNVEVDPKLFEKPQ